MSVPESAPSRRILVDLTLWLDQRGRPTGIPRVTHEVVRRSAGRSPGGVPVGRILFLRGRWLEVSAAPDWLLGCVRAARQTTRTLAAEGDAAAAAGRALRALGFWAAHHGARLFASLAARLLRLCPSPSLGPGDTVLSLDMQSRALPGLDAAVSRGAQVVSVLYDCLPLTHPELFPLPATRESYLAWHGWVARHASGLIAISRVSLHEARRLMPGASCWHAWFHLGGDFTPAEPAALRPEIAAMISGPSFLMVGTVEPRKNHAVVVSAFELAWSRGCPAALLIVGDRGWNNRELLERIGRLRAAGRPVGVFHDVADGELAAAYRQARSLIAASTVEGFGLSLAEAGARGLPVLASDIPVFREIAPRGTRFFPAGDSESLARLVEQSAATPPARAAASPLSWDVSVRGLLALVDGSAPRDAGPPA